MALNSGWNKRPSNGQQQTQERAERPTFRAGVYTLEYLGAREGQQKSYEDRHKTDSEARFEDCIHFVFRMVQRGADAAVERVNAMPFGPERDKAVAAFRAKYPGHGLQFWLTASAKFSVGGENRKASKTYEVSKGLLADGADLTEDQIKNLTELLNALEGEDTPPQFECLLGAPPKNRLEKVLARIADDDRLPAWRPIERAADPREDDDDTSIVCSTAGCGAAIHGWERTRGENAGWVTNTEWAAEMEERYGGIYCQRHLREVKAASQNVPF